MLVTTVELPYKTLCNLVVCSHKESQGLLKTKCSYIKQNQTLSNYSVIYQPFSFRIYCRKIFVMVLTLVLFEFNFFLFYMTTK